MRSILQDIDVAKRDAAKPRRGLRERLTDLDAGLKKVLASLWTSPKRRAIAGSVLALAVVGGGVGTYLAMRLKPPPDYETADLKTVFDYTLLTEDFNRLPVEQRLELVGQLVGRMESMKASESTMLAGFAAGIAGSAADQLMENASRLMLDSADMFAAEYINVPAEERDAYLDEAFVEISKLADMLGQNTRDISDEARLAEGRRQAQRDAEYIRSGRVPTEGAARMFLFLDRGIGDHASAHQKARVTNLLRDMTVRLRNGG